MKGNAVPAVVVAALAYCVVGLVFGARAGQAASHQSVVAWRWAAWVVSAVVFGGHIVFEQLRLRTSPTITAVHVSLAAGLGAFGLAAAANIHARTVSPPQHSPLLALSLAIWPIITAAPAFVVALVAASLFARIRRGVQRGEETP
jgi:hypothetical protein